MAALAIIRQRNAHGMRNRITFAQPGGVWRVRTEPDSRGRIVCITSRPFRKWSPIDWLYRAIDWWNVGRHF